MAFAQAATTHARVRVTLRPGNGWKVTKPTGAASSSYRTSESFNFRAHPSGLGCVAVGVDPSRCRRAREAGQVNDLHHRPELRRIAATVSANFRPGASLSGRIQISNPARGRQSVFLPPPPIHPLEVVAVKASERAASVAFLAFYHQHSPGRCQ